MFCSISGKETEDPVVSVKSGHIFDRTLLNKWLDGNDSRCPVTKEILQPEDILPVKSSHITKPRIPATTSIPSLISVFQNEWDSLMLETFSLREQLQNVRQELSHSLYQHDAACRVIARLIKERDEARNTLANLSANNVAQPSNSQVNSTDGGSSSAEGLPQPVKEKMINKSKELARNRKKREISDNLALIEDVKEYQVTMSHIIQKGKDNSALCLDSKEHLVAVGGTDGVYFFNQNDKHVNKLKHGHTAPVRDVLLHPSQNVLLTASDDKSAKVWVSEKLDIHFQETHAVDVHKSSVVACALQPTGQYWLSAAEEGDWALHDLTTSTCLTHHQQNSKLFCGRVHPDGLLAGFGMEKGVAIWDIKSEKNVANFEHSTGVLGLSFSENGFHMATVTDPNVVQLWDLRKKAAIHTLNLESTSNRSIAFDHSGTFLAVGGSDIRVFVGRSLDHVATYEKHTGAVSGLKWTENAHGLMSVGLDRSFKLWGTKEASNKKRKTK